MKKLFFLGYIAVALINSCDKDNNNVKRELKGPETAFENGIAWTTVELNADGTPSSASIIINEAAMKSLATTTDSNMQMNMASIPFNDSATKLPFTHALLMWNPHGHEPAPIYTLPHFDFHFYFQSEAERMAIPPFETDSSKFIIYPAPEFFPGNYIPTPGGVPQMGTHWADTTAPEFNGKTFTKTFIYGSYNGKITFLEPMITKAFIDSTNAFESSFPQPAKFPSAGYYPTKYKMSKSNGDVIVSLTDFVYRQ